MRDATRGGVAAVLHEWAETCGAAMWIDEASLPLSPSTQGICETLGLDPLFIANEGTFVAAVAPHRIDDALAVFREFDSLPGLRCDRRGQAAPSLARCGPPRCWGRPAS